MRLINTRTHLFEEFIGRNIPKYAILSHTWEGEEVSFKDMDDPSHVRKKGFQKIAMTCQLAAQANFQYVWVDTCCIDKSSSAELTEAINSMYRWYERAQVCYVYLSDLPASASLDMELKDCRWFTRGWTLQELIAPKDVIFFDQDWNKRGSKRNLVEELSKITTIDAGVLRKEVSLASLLVARKMSWAAHRETTRTEDIAYCLLGIFDVNMPLLYGEEEKAFRRLQEEIIKSTPDLSIFAWRLPIETRQGVDASERVFSGILAESVVGFSGCSSLERRPNFEKSEFAMSNSGVKIHLQLLFEPARRGYTLPLNCFLNRTVSLGVRLRKCGFEQFVREDPCNFFEYAHASARSVPTNCFLLTTLPFLNVAPDAQYLDQNFIIADTRSGCLQIRAQSNMIIHDVWPVGRFDKEDGLFCVQGNSGRDSASFRLQVAFRLEIRGHELRGGFDCMFYAVGWATGDASRLQCSLLLYSPSDTTMNRFQSDRSQWDYDAAGFVMGLKYYQVPKTSAVVFKTSESAFGVLVTFKTTLVTDPKICRNAFWRVEFSTEVHKMKNLPQIREDQWRLE